ncbi:MAG: hypothetical protein ACPGVV_10305 [Croceimicrobium sp.]|nr:hypothetical protein [Bacteroidota bacterium]
MDQNEHLEALKDIRSMMQRSVRFLSLSGLSGVFAGIYALLTAWLAHERISDPTKVLDPGTPKYLMLLAAGCLVLAIGTAFLFTRNNARKKGLKMWDESAKLAMINLAIPLAAGGIFCFALLKANIYGFIAPASLIFYGLALVLSSRNTYPMIKQLGLLEIALGLVASFYLGHGILFWAIGFGLLHVIYGTYMYLKFDRA